MNVLLTSLQPVGGIRTFLSYMYGSSQFEDYKFTLLAPYADLPDYFAAQLDQKKFRVVTVDGQPMELIRSIRRSLRREKYDLLHSHGLRTGFFGEIARFGHQVQHLVTIHDVFLPEMFDGLSGCARKIALNRVLPRCDAIHTVSFDCAQNFAEYVPKVSSANLFPILNGIDTDRFQRASAMNVQEILGVNKDDFLIGFFGRFMGQKGFRTLIDAAEILKRRGDFDFKIVTFGWGGYIREDYEYLCNKGLASFFVQAPHTEEPERWMVSMDLIAMPSRWEACGLVAMEALAAGVPIITTNCIGLREVVANTPVQTINAGSSLELANAILREYEQKRSPEFQLFKRQAAERFSINSAASKLKKLYASLLSG